MKNFLVKCKFKSVKRSILTNSKNMPVCKSYDCKLRHMTVTGGFIVKK